MNGSNISSGLRKPNVTSAVTCETLETRNLFTSVALDPSFGGGAVQTNFGNAFENARHIVVLKDGRPLVTGYTATTEVIAVYNPNGTLSTAFDGDGKLLLSAQLAASLGADAPVPVQTPDGGILLVGSKQSLKLKLNGAIDTAYGQNGISKTLITANSFGYSLLSDAAMLPNGTYRQVTANNDDHRLRLQEISSTGTITRSLGIDLGASSYCSSIVLDLSGVTFISNGIDTHSVKALRRNLDLTPATDFAINGVLDLKPAYTAWANAHGPWFDVEGGVPLNGIPTDLGISNLNRTATGFTAGGTVSGFSPAAPKNYSEDGGFSTFVNFKISADGQTVSVTNDEVPPAQTVFRAQDSGKYGENYAFAGSFTRPDGSKIFFNAQPYVGSSDLYANEAAAASDGGYYVVGFGAINGKPRDVGFIITKTAPLAKAATTATINGVLFNDDDGDRSFSPETEGVNAGKTVFLDTNNNGKLDTGERQTTSDVYGHYQFSNVTPGTYHVRRVLPAGYQVTDPNKTVVAANGQVSEVDIGSTSRGLITITGKLTSPAFSDFFIDSNHNGLFDGPETFIQFVGVSDDGATVFAQIALPAGSYRIAVEQTAGTVVKPGTPSFYDITVVNGKATALTFTLVPAVAAGTVSGQVYVKNNGGQQPVGISNDLLFVDLNKNGVMEGNEPSTLTDIKGNYTFTLQPGTYRIVAQTPSATQPISFPNGFADITVTSGQATNLSWQFADHGAYPSKITGTLFNDDNFNGVLDANETINKNRTVYIDANHNGKLDAGEKQTQTDNGGKYLFTGLATGSYDIKRVLAGPEYRITTSTTPVNLAAAQTLVFNIGSTSRPA